MERCELSIKDIFKHNTGKSHTAREIEGLFKDLENTLKGSQERR